MSTRSDHSYGAIKFNYVFIFAFLIASAIVVLSVVSPTHALLFARGGVLLAAAVLGFLLGINWNQRLDSSDDSVADLPSFLRPRAMLLGFSVLLPLVALGAGVAYYSGSHTVVDLTTGLVEMCVLASVETVFLLIGRVVQRR